MDGIITIVCALIGSGAATALVTGLLGRRAQRRRTETGESQGMRWLLQDRLEQQGLRYLRRGLITYEELRNWNRGLVRPVEARPPVHHHVPGEGG